MYRYTANSKQLYRISFIWNQHTFILYTGTLQTANIYTVYRQTANSTFHTVSRHTVNTTQLYRILLHCKQHTVITHTGKLQTADNYTVYMSMQKAHSYIVYRYTANSTIYTLYRYTANTTVIPHTGTLQTPHCYTAYRYTANTTHLYRIQVNGIRHTVIQYTRYTANSTRSFP